MRIGNYVVRQDTHCWILATVKVRESGKRKGQEYEFDPVFPGTLPYALEMLLERMVRDGLDPDPTLAETVATVAHCYRTIREAV